MAEEGPSPGGGARFLLIVASLVVVVAGLRAASQLILPFLVSLFIAILSLPLLSWLQSRKVPTGLAVLATVAADVAVLAGLGLLVGGSVNDFTAEVPKYQARLGAMVTSTMQWLEARGVRTTSWLSPEQLNPGALMNLVGGTLRGVAAVLSNVVLVVLTTVFILGEAATFPEKLQSALRKRDFDPGRFRKITREVQHYLAIKTLISLATGVLVALWVWIMGVDFPLLWGVSAFLLNYIPNLGSILAAIPTVLLALIQFGVGRAALVGAGYVVVNLVLGNVVEPSLMGRKLGLSTLVVFLSLVFWGWVWGPVGMLLSVPLTMIVKIMLENTDDLRWIAVLLDAKPRPLDTPPPPDPAPAG
jgi:AI-2 transport protein TqsA